MQRHIFRMLMAIGIVSGMSCCHELFAQIPVGLSSNLISFAIQPPANQWSTFNVLPSNVTGVQDTTQLDAAVLTNTAAGITAALNASNANPPNAVGPAVWSSPGQYIQTRPSGNTFTLLMATLQNTSGTNLSGIKVDYTFAAAAILTEQLPGFRVYFSLSGTAGTWQNISLLSGNATPGARTATLYFGNWTNGATAYLLWADDNGSPSPDTACQMDNFGVIGIPAAPAISVQPQSQSFAPGASLSLSVDATGILPLTYAWYKDGIVAPVGTNQTYYVSAAQISDSGLYHVTVSNSFGSVNSSNATVEIGCSTPPFFTLQPTNQILTSGATISLNAAAGGTAPLSYQWYRNDVAIIGATNTSYSKTNANWDDSGIYTIVAVNCGGSTVSEGASVAIPEPPYTIAGLTNQVWRYNQLGIDIGNTWKQSAYNDSGWPSGRGVLGVETLASVAQLLNTPLSLNNAMGQYVSAFYFRTHFLLTNEPDTVSLVISNLIDDGAVVYLNGDEIYRINMPEGTINWATLAPGTITEGAFITRSISGRNVNLIQGDNVLAVEVHQTGTASADVVMGMHVNVLPLAPTILVITNQPRDASTEQGGVATFEVGAEGGRQQFQWFKEGVPLPNATRPRLTITNAVLQDAGYYAVLVSNAVARVFSRLAYLSVDPEITPPRLVSAEAVDDSHVLLSFSKALSGDTANNSLNYFITTFGGGNLSVISAVLTNNTNVLLTADSLVAEGTYSVTVSNVTDATGLHTPIGLNNVAPIGLPVILVPYDASWRVLDPYPPYDNPDPGPSWKDVVTTATDAWGEGPGAFFIGQDAGFLPASVGTYLTPSPYVSSYFRHEFNLTRSRGGLTLDLTIAWNDGAVLYLNGVEFWRTNMPDGNPTYLTPAGTVSTTMVSRIEVPADLLYPSVNVFAAELHQQAPNDGQKAFAFELRAISESAVGGPIQIISGPLNISATEGETVTFGVSQMGAETFQWRIDNTNAPGATDATFKLEASLALNGALISLALSNAASSALSTNALLFVRPDTTSPVLLSANATSNAVLVSFSEPIDNATATDISNYTIQTVLGTVEIQSAVRTNQTNVLLFVGTQLFGGTLTVRNVRDTALSPNVVASNSAAEIGFTSTMTPISGAWRFNQSGTDIGSAWKNVGYDDSTWPTGEALFLGKRGTIPSTPEPIRTTLTLSNAGNSAQITTYYFRSSFNLPHSVTGIVALRTIVDDGAVIYVNGAELYRLRMPAGSVSYATLALAPAVGDPAYEGPFIFGPIILPAGPNLLAVEVHQESLVSSDTSFAMVVTLARPGTLLSGSIPASLQIHRWGGQLAVQWPGSGVGLLQTAQSVVGPWTSWTNASNPTFVTPTAPLRLFRLGE